MERVIALLVVFNAAFSCASALQCHFCLNMEGVEGSTTKCNNPGSEFMNTCTSPMSDLVPKCGKYDGTLSASVLGMEISIQGLSRECLYLAADNVPENKCYKGNSALPWLQTMVPGGADLASVRFDGVVCFCDNEDGCNGVASVKALAWLLGMLVIVAVLWVY